MPLQCRRKATTPPPRRRFKRSAFKPVNTEVLKFLKVLYSNVDSGLINKLDELRLLVTEKEPDIIILNEVLPKRLRRRKNISSTDFKLDGYELFLPSDQVGRGVLMYFKTFLNVCEVDCLNNDGFEESIWIRVKLWNQDSLLIGNIYRSPSSSVANNAHLNELILKATSQKDSHLLIVGDFNYGNIDWENMQSRDSVDQCSSIFVETIKDSFLHQHVESETRFRQGQTPSRLDLLFTNESSMINDLEYLPPLGASDHVCLFFQFLCYTEKRLSKETRYNFHKGDYDLLRSYLGSVDWHSNQNRDVVDQWNFLCDKVAEGVERSVPKFSPVNKSKKNPWMNRDSVNAVKEKRKAWKRYSHCKSKQNFQTYAEKRNKSTAACRTARINFERKLAENIKTDSKSFWNYVNSQTKTKHGICDLTDQDGNLTSSDIQKANLLNTFFSSVFTNEKTDVIPTLVDRNFTSDLSDLHISNDMVVKKLNKLNPGKSPGIDGIHPKVLKECSECISEFLSSMFNQSMDSGILPDIWKKARISPIFKKGDKHKCSNYRPVSLTVVLCKILESFVRDSIMTHMDRNNLFTPHQHGFREKRSCVTQLLEVIEVWTDILERGSNVDCVYLDFAKAFDTVPFKRLLLKLQAYGIRGKVYHWIENFLSSRSQQVKVGTQCSDWAEVKSGIPQGSVLGPTLFLIYINDLPDVVENVVKLFADDTKLYKAVSCPADCDSLQRDLDSLSTWSNTWQLKFNASKCHCMHIGKNNPCHSYLMNDNSQTTVIINTDKEKDLGVLFDNDLKFTEHIAQKVKKANQMLGMVCRTFTCLEVEVFLPLYKSFIRPHLEYATSVWNPSLKKDIVNIENVQRRATRVVKGLKNLTYEERLRHLGLPTLCYRRERSDMLQLFKILQKYEIVTLENVKVSTSNVTRGHDFKLCKNFTGSRRSQNRFSNRVVNPWNSLPNDTVIASSVNSFKSQLNAAWKTRDNKFSFV